jgi:hypothetical protein
MKFPFLPAVAAAGLLFAPIAFAQTSTVTATCKDGTSFSGTTRSGACKGHKGVAKWESAATAAPAAAAPGMTPATPPKTHAASTTGTASPAIPNERAASETGSTGKAAAQAGRPGQVWVNTESKVYHCPGDRYYGKTKTGQFMSLPAAQAAGDRPAGGKACTS